MLRGVNNCVQSAANGLPGSSTLMSIADTALARDSRDNIESFIIVANGRRKSNRVARTSSEKLKENERRWLIRAMSVAVK
jgi:hypothetical protein